MKLGYYEALSQFAVKKFLLLVMFLDLSKTSRLIQEDPCLFCIDAEHKVSVAIDIDTFLSKIMVISA